MVGRGLEWRFSEYFYSHGDDEETEAPGGTVTHPRSLSLQWLGLESNSVCLTPWTGSEMLSACWGGRGGERRETAGAGWVLKARKRCLYSAPLFAGFEKGAQHTYPLWSAE